MVTDERIRTRHHPLSIQAEGRTDHQSRHRRYDTTEEGSWHRLMVGKTDCELWQATRRIRRRRAAEGDRGISGRSPALLQNSLSTDIKAEHKRADHKPAAPSSIHKLLSGKGDLRLSKTERKNYRPFATIPSKGFSTGGNRTPQTIHSLLMRI